MFLIFTDFAAVDSSFGNTCLYKQTCASVFWGQLQQSLFEVHCSSCLRYVQRVLFPKGSVGRVTERFVGFLAASQDQLTTL